LIVANTPNHHHASPSAGSWAKVRLAPTPFSRALYISEYTVQDHLSNAFDKERVRGRHALVKRLFFVNLSGYKTPSRDLQHLRH
jgi:hypothetical protein